MLYGKTRDHVMELRAVLMDGTEWYSRRSTTRRIDTPCPDTRVIAWIDARALATLFVSAITVAELRAGVALLPAGKRRPGLQASHH